MPEQHVILACKQGKLWARREVYEQYAPSMMALCRRYVPDTDDAKDVLQDGFIKVFTEISKYSGKGSFGGWVRKIFVNTSLDYIRKKSRLNQKELRMDVEMEQTYDNSYDIEAGLSYTYLYSRFNRNDRLVYRGSLKQHYVGIPVFMEASEFRSTVAV